MTMISELFDSFLEDIEQTLNELDQGLGNLRIDPDSAKDAERMGALGVLAHRLRGTAGLYGFPQLSQLAALGERLLESKPVLPKGQRDEFLEVLQIIVDTMLTGLSDITRGLSETEVGLNFAQAGGTVRLQKLLRDNPLAFKPPAPVQYRFAETVDETSEEAPKGKGQTVEEEIRDFVKTNGEVWEYFSPEIREHVDSLRNQLEQEEEDITSMFRSAHTIKGSSYMVGFNTLGDFGHKMEDLLGAIRDGQRGLDETARSVLEHSVEAIDQILGIGEGRRSQVSEPLKLLELQLAALASGQNDIPTELESEKPAAAPASAAGATPSASETVSVGVAAAVPSPEAAPQRTTIRVDTRQLDQLMDRVGELVVARARLTQAIGRLDEMQNAMLESQERLQRTVRDFEERYLNPDMVKLGEENESSRGNQAPSQTPGMTDVRQQFDELEFDTYNDLNILARSITELSADFSEVRARFADELESLAEEGEEFGKITRRLRIDVSRTNRQPFSQITPRLRRWARDRADRFDLMFQGEQVEIENLILQGLSEPLLHLLTNAVNHGLETPQERVSAGKPAKGRVVISVMEEGNFLEVTVRDDGGGINADAVREKALARGLRSASELAQLSNADLYRLILLPGLSTAQQVTSEAGRGVGLDVVATSVRRLGGELLIRSTPGVGTSFTMRLPTSQRIADVLEAYVGEHAVGFTVATVRALREIEEHEVYMEDEGFSIMYEGEYLPIIDLRQMWGIQTSDLPRSVAILNSSFGLTAVAVDEFGQIEEVAINPLGPLLSRLEYLSGFTTSTGGAVMPILEPAGLARLAGRRSAWLQPEEMRMNAVRRKVLLVDDSLSVRRLVGKMLERGGYEVQTANDGQEALELVQLGAQFDAVITDLEMPRMNGYELVEAVRAHPGSEKLPLVVMTTRAGEKHQRLAFQLGANDYFTKPVDEALLMRRLESLVEA